MTTLVVSDLAHTHAIDGALDLEQAIAYPHDVALTFCTRNKAISQYCGMRFNSFAVLDDGRVFAADDRRGLFEFDGSDTDDNAQIAARFRTATTDFGSSKQKRLRSAYIGGEADGDLTMTVRNDEANSRSRTFTPENTNGTQQSGKLSIGRDGKGRYWDVEIGNVLGSDFGIDQIDVVSIVLGGKPSGS